MPVWEASPKQEVGARTLRKKIHDRFPEYFVRCGLFAYFMRCLVLWVWVGVCRGIRARLARPLVPDPRTSTSPSTTKSPTYSFPEEGLAGNDAGKAGALLAKRKAANDWDGTLAKLQVKLEWECVGGGVEVECVCGCVDGRWRAQTPVSF